VSYTLLSLSSLLSLQLVGVCFNTIEGGKRGHPEHYTFAVHNPECS
jgi:hypothetical protein